MLEPNIISFIGLANMQNLQIYILGDGDNVRERIESLLFSKQFEKLSIVSEKFTESIKSMKSMVISDLSGEVIMAGGDDILFVLSKDSYERTKVERLGEFFRTQTGNTISFGVGETVETAYLNLRKAKTTRNGIVIDEGM